MGETSETIRAGGREVPLRSWEAEVFARAAGWIVLFRGLGFAVAASVGAIALSRHGGAGAGVGAAMAFGGAQAIVGAGLLHRRRWAFMALPAAVIGWFVLLLPTWGLGPHGPAPLLRLLWMDPVLRILFPAACLPDLFALYAAWRREGKQAFQPGQPPLPLLLTAWRTRATGNVLVAVGMTGLAFLSMSACILFGPGFLLA